MVSFQPAEGKRKEKRKRKIAFSSQSKLKKTQIHRIPLNFTESPEFQRFCGKAKNIRENKSGNLNLFILGDSHMQCEDFGQALIQYMIDSLSLTNAGRGFAFPYPLARTSHRSENQYGSGSDWRGCKFTKESNSCDWGLAGWTAHWDHDSVRFFWGQGGSLFYPGDQICLFSPERCGSSHQVFIVDSSGKELPLIFDREKGGFWGKLDFLSERVRFRVQRNKGDSSDFVLQGFFANPISSGLVSGISGTNGARLDHYLLNPDFPRHLRIINPDILIIALGTNEAFLPNFSSENVRKNLFNLLSRIKAAVPEAALVLIGPPDHKYGRRSNPKVKEINQVFSEAAEELDFSFWNQQKAMGGTGSIYNWRKKGLATKDMVHFTPAGYKLQAQLFGSALKPFLKP